MSGKPPIRPPAINPRAVSMTVNTTTKDAFILTKGDV
jgi:hypothetical protein